MYVYPAVDQDYNLTLKGPDNTPIPSNIVLAADPVSLNVNLRRDGEAGEQTETIILTLMHNPAFPPAENQILLYSTVIINVQDKDRTYIRVCTFMYICVQ